MLFYSFVLASAATLALAQSVGTGANTLIAATSGAPYPLANGTGPYVGATGALPGTGTAIVTQVQTATASAPQSTTTEVTSGTNPNSNSGSGSGGEGAAGSSGVRPSQTSTAGAPVMTAGAGLAAIMGAAVVLL